MCVTTAVISGKSSRTELCSQRGQRNRDRGQGGIKYDTVHFSLDMGLVKQLRRPSEVRGLEAQVAREHDGINTLRVREKVKRKA